MKKSLRILDLIKKTKTTNNQFTVTYSSKKTSINSFTVQENEVIYNQMFLLKYIFQQIRNFTINLI